jgi:hypothetical protein
VVKPVAMSTHLQDQASRHQVDIRETPRRHDEVEMRQSRQWVTRQSPEWSKRQVLVAGLLDCGRNGYITIPKAYLPLRGRFRARPEQ